ncbi:MAG TPA: hypothetical protein VGV37_23255 [Aliidongia sp.]|uniref:hypothetical protein n=1 Tax=Aliidongia sp. TaxID=1914230 RepID=UPI002DDD7FD5|nr:hypothetical protein [Aliidongia sp.]HEV2677467.1 hypothetical protein [Aliidongia sp.]
MTPQSTFMVVAPILPEREGALRLLLNGMNRLPGTADPENALLPFGRFDRLHYARFVILRDGTLGDLAAVGIAFPDAPVYLAFLGDCDGPAESLLDAFAAEAGPGLRRIFDHCEGFDETIDLGGWLRAANVTPAVRYVNWVGRTAVQIRHDAALHAVLRAYLVQHAAVLAGEPPRAISDRLRAHSRAAGPAPYREQPTPPGWRVGEVLDAIGGALLLLLLAPPLLLVAPIFLVLLRWHERADPAITPRPDPVHVADLSRIEDHDVGNQFSAFGTVKPGRFRRTTLIALLWLVNYTTRHIYTRGSLGRVGTIHFARWVFLDDKRRLFFASNYDGSLDSYMDDFINKVAFGLNLVFSNGIGYPRTRFLVLGGAKDEQAFKYYIRRHQLPTEVWYKAYPGLTAYDLARNASISAGLDRDDMTDREIRQWLATI